MDQTETDGLITGLRAGNRRQLAQALSMLEDRRTPNSFLVDRLQPYLSGNAVIGFTGPPGAGKSTLINALTHAWRQRGLKIAIIAVDPSSPVSGGAILGDRIRMTAALNDEGVFVRSLASHGHLGGLSPAAVLMIDAFDVAGYDLVLLETVGTGQNEIDIASIADVGVVIAAPGLGDGIQAMKSGLLEIADTLIVNKSDKPEARETAQQLQAAISLRHSVGRHPEVFLTTATTKHGIADVADHITKLAEEKRAEISPSENRLRRGRYILERLAVERVRTALSETASPSIDALIDSFMSGRIDAPHVLQELFAGKPGVK